MTNLFRLGQQATQNAAQAVRDAQENIPPQDVQVAPLSFDAILNSIPCRVTVEHNQHKTDKAPKSDIGPNAEVWKRYVLETDRADKELVEGWNNSLDMLLIFVRSLASVTLTSNVRPMWSQAALFSAISTAFILESTQDLKPDFAEVSAHTLAAILAAVSSGSTANSSDIPTMDQSEFSPSAAAIQVNILWFTSLSLSVAVALIAIVAKDWCYQFMATRTGPALVQGRRRQLRWEGIEQWRMREILNVLPLMMHAALLLFAIGLSLYLWDINPQVALPVVVTTVAVGVFYFVTLLLPLFFRYCPFTTGPMKLILPYWYKVARPTLKLVLECLGWLVVPFVALFAVMKQCLKRSPTRRWNLKAEGRKSGLRHWAAQLSFIGCWDESKQLVAGRVKLISDSFMVDRSQLDRQDTPMDSTTSSMLGWMIAQCENLDSVDIALKSLLCTKPWLPRVPLQKCGAFEATFMRMSTDLVAWTSISDSKGPESEKLKESVLVQSQYLSMMSHTEVIKKPDGYLETLHELYQVIDQCWNTDHNYRRASKELGSLSLHLSDQWDREDRYREQLDRQWKLIGMIIKKVVDLSAADITHLVEGIAKSYIYAPDQSPTPLVVLLNIQPYSQDKDICRMIGVALTMAYIEKHGSHSRDLTTNRVPQQSRAMKTYLDLTATAPTDDRWHTCERLLLFGLTSTLVNCVESTDRSNIQTSVDIICDQERQILQPSSLSLAYLTLPQDSLITLINLVFPDMDSGTHVAPPVITTPSRTSGDVAIEMSDPPPTAGLELDKVEPSSTVKMDPSDPSRMKLAKCLLAFARDVSNQYFLQDDSTPWKPAEDTLHSAVDAIIRSNLHIHAYHTIHSQTGDLVPYCMSSLWAFTWALLWKWRVTSGSIELDIPSVLGPLRVSQGDLPAYVDGMGYTDSWVEKIRLACEQSPQSVLDSQILDWMIIFYQSYSESDHGPSTADASGSEPPKTWRSILEDLHKACKDRVAQSAPNNNQDRHPHETPPAEGANDRSAQTDAGGVAQDGEPEDSDRAHAEMQLDCLSP
ncbi:hypothetical protein RhiXN_12199 [Rhizoctonia solani]|uniref:DUF6535 domain-containing protein n=1 Tax=Rhizoctonia solani TaxID=456999 RepID=A0A8H8P855_9AGAM|nr:uncharacterized protein RhiXN_12199 [Rhizoctonia solani]QRW26538.1 hypothetical protein RhiXN_12199 [Rhizoctonia solani]